MWSKGENFYSRTITEAYFDEVTVIPEYNNEHYCSLGRTEILKKTKEIRLASQISSAMFQQTSTWEQYFQNCEKKKVNQEFHTLLSYCFCEMA